MKKKTVINDNQENSSLKQILIDLEKILVQSNTSNSINVLNALQTLKNELNNNAQYISQTDTIFNRHHYNEKKLHFTKLRNYKSLQIVSNLSANSVKVLFYMIQLMSQNNLVAVKVKITSKELHQSLNTFRKSLEELEQNGCIVKVLEGKKDGTGTIYMINPEIANTSKYVGTTEENFKKITSDTQLNNFLLLNNCKSNVISSKTFVDDTAISYNFSEILQNNSNTKQQQNQQNNNESIENTEFLEEFEFDFAEDLELNEIFDFDSEEEE